MEIQPLNPDSSLLAKKMKKRKPQEDDIPVMAICNYKKKTRLVNFNQFPQIVVYALITLLKKGGATIEAIEKYIVKRYEVTFPNIRRFIQIILDRAIEMGYLMKVSTNKNQIIYTFPFSSSKPIPEFAYFMMQKIAKSLKRKRKKKKHPPDKKKIIL